MATTSYASLLELRAAIRFRKVVRFVHKGHSYTVEPQALRNAVRTGALVLDAWVQAGADPGWKTFRYCEIRDLQVLNQAFVPRELPDRTLTVVAA